MDFYRELDKIARTADRSRWDIVGELSLAATTWGGPEEGPLGAVKQHGDEKGIQSIQSLSRRSAVSLGSSRTDLTQSVCAHCYPSGMHASGHAVKAPPVRREVGRVASSP